MTSILEHLGVIIAVPDRARHLEVGGAPVPLRLARQMRRAGYGGPIVLVYSETPSLDLPNGARIVSADELTLPCSQWVCVPGDVVLDHAPGSFEPTSDIDRTRSWAKEVCRGAMAPVEIPILGRVVDAASADELERRLIGRAQDPNFTRLWGRRLSRRISRRLVRENTSPNAVTLIALLFGLTAAGMFSLGSYAWTLAGSIVLIFSRLLDDCDGEVARLAVRESRFGAALDVMSDVIVHAAAFAGLALGLGNAWIPLVLLLSGGSISTLLVLRHVSGSKLVEQSRVARFLERGASGDFAYVLFPFALIGRPDWFLWGAAVGSHVYWIALAVVILRHRGTLLETTLYVMGAALLAALIIQIGPETLLSEIGLVGWGFLPVLGVEILTLSAAAVGWYYAITPNARRLRFRKLWAFRLIAEAINHLTPTATIGGEVVRARLAAPWMGGREAAASVTLAKLSETAAQVVVLGIGLIALLPFVETLGGYRWGMLAAVALGLVGILFLLRLLDRGLFTLAARKFPRWGWLQRHQEDLLTIDALIRDCVRRRPADLVRSIVWHTGSYAARLIEVWIVLYLLGVTPTWPLVVGIEVLSVLIDGVLFFIPGKLGSQEGGKMLIFLALGLPVEKGLALGLVRRGRELTWDVIGLALYALIPAKPADQQAPA